MRQLTIKQIVQYLLDFSEFRITSVSDYSCTTLYIFKRSLKFNSQFINLLFPDEFLTELELVKLLISFRDDDSGKLHFYLASNKDAEFKEVCIRL